MKYILYHKSPFIGEKSPAPCSLRKQSQEGEKNRQQHEGKGEEPPRGRDVGSRIGSRVRHRAISRKEARKPAQGERQTAARRRKGGRRAQERDDRDDAQELARHQPAAPETEPMILTIGKNIAMTIVPTTTAKTMMSAGSIAAVMPATA